MTTDEPDGITRYNLDDDHLGDELPARSYWWSLHRPETYALASLAVAFASLISVGPGQEIAQAVLYGVGGPSSGRDLLYALSGVRLAMALFAILAAVLSIRSEDADSTWSPPVARAGILLAIVDAVLAAAALIVTATVSDPSSQSF
ncbi:MAG: hypothetical protein JO079_09050 [Frankiaceae bacterium]|nr:hypothetical protein [Frankiaceae bacterium]